MSGDASSPTAPLTTALVLAGGGTKGAFEVGVLRYLATEKHLLPDIITATSAGAIIGTVIAQAATADEFSTCVDDLRQDLLSMTDTGSVFGDQPWLSALRGTKWGDAVNDFVTVQSRPPIPGTTAASIVGPLRPASIRLHQIARAVRDVPHLVRALMVGRGHFGSILTLDPISDALRGQQPGSGFVPVDPDRVARSGRQLRLAVTALQAGVLRYVTEHGELVEDDAVTPVVGAKPVGVLEGLLASSSVPLIFPPRPMGDDVYVDGGVLRNIPVDAAAALGARRIVAVTAVPFIGPRDERDFTKASMIGVHLRTAAVISLLGRQRDDVRLALPEGTSLQVIDPTVDVVGPFEVAQGLMLIDMDYGWMRGADMMAVQDDERNDARSLSDAITAARVRSWWLEETWWKTGRPTGGDIRRLRREKEAVSRLLDERRKAGFLVPDEAEAWGHDYERHDGPRPATLPTL